MLGGTRRTFDFVTANALREGGMRVSPLWGAVMLLACCSVTGFVVTPGGLCRGAARPRCLRTAPVRAGAAGRRGRGAGLRVRMQEEEEEAQQQIQYYKEEGGDEPAREGLGRVEELGLFPLGLVLNPGATIPLHIFEMRYRNLFNKAWDSDNKKYGIVMYNGEKNAWAKVGTAAELLRFQPLPDGKILTVSKGVERFRVLKVTREGNAMEYMKALVEYIDDEKTETDLAELEGRVWGLLKDVLRLSNELYGKSLDLKDTIKALAPEREKGAEGQGEELSEESRQRLFSFAVSQVLDMPLEDQQLMLQSQVTSQRLTKQVKLLEKAKQYLAAQLSLKKAFTGPPADESEEDSQ